MWRKISYQRFGCAPSAAFPNGHMAPRPMLRVDLLNGSNRFGCFGIVDSGADFCTFPLSFAIQLGLDPLTANSSISTGLGNSSVPTYYWNIKLDLQGLTTLDVYAGFTTGLESYGLGLLGQTGFFDRFPVAFDLKNGIFMIDVV